MFIVNLRSECSNKALKIVNIIVMVILSLHCLAEFFHIAYYSWFGSIMLNSGPSNKKSHHNQSLDVEFHKIRLRIREKIVIGSRNEQNITIWGY